MKHLIYLNISVLWKIFVRAEVRYFVQQANTADTDKLVSSFGLFSINIPDTTQEDRPGRLFQFQKLKNSFFSFIAFGQKMDNENWIMIGDVLPSFWCLMKLTPDIGIKRRVPLITEPSVYYLECWQVADLEKGRIFTATGAEPEFVGTVFQLIVSFAPWS